MVDSQELHDLIVERSKIDKYNYIYIEDEIFYISNEWLIGTFAGGEVSGKTLEECLHKIIKYFNNNLGHHGMVGSILKDSGYPDLRKVKNYLESEI